MPSPFPGMNPYLEQDDAWQDFHDRLIPALGDALSPQVSPDFIVKIEEHLYIHEPSAEQRLFMGRSDVSIAQGSRAPAGGGAATALMAPTRAFIAVDIEKKTFLGIRDRKNRELITVIELLSPSNKRPGPDRDQYIVKRGNVLKSTAHLVEIDLLREGPRLPMEEAVPSNYYVLISRAENRPDVGLWPIMLRDRLPTIPIPLRTPWPDVTLDLQAALHTVYDRAYYKDYIYEGTPAPPLEEQDGDWAVSLVKGSRD